MQGGYTFILSCRNPHTFLSQYFFVAITEKIVSMNLRPVADWMNRQTFR